MLLFSSLEYSSSDITDSAGKTMQLGGGGGGGGMFNLIQL